MKSTPGKKYRVELRQRRLTCYGGYVFDCVTGKELNACRPGFPDEFYKLSLEELNASILYIYTEGESFDSDEGIWYFDYEEVDVGFWGRKMEKRLVAKFKHYYKRYEIRFTSGNYPKLEMNCWYELHPDMEYPYGGFIVHDNEAKRDYPENSFPPEFQRMSADYLDKVCRFILPEKDAEEDYRMKFGYYRKYESQGWLETPKTWTELEFRPISYMNKAKIERLKIRWNVY